MKKSLIALAVTAAVAAPLANAAPKLYGRVNLSVESYKKDFENPATADQEYTRTVSNASRFGVKGEDELTANLSAVYLIEFEVAGDGEDASGIAGSSKLDLLQRNRYIGIKSNTLGTLKLGKYDTYLKSAQGETDLFNDFLGDEKFVIAGENRINNVIGYESPKFIDALTFNVLAQTQDSATPANGISASVVYNNETSGIYGALAIDNNITGDTAISGKRESDNVRLVGSYKIQDLTLNAQYQTSEQSSVAAGANKNKETGWQLGVAYKLGDEVLKAQFGEAKADNSAAAVQKHNQWSVGVDHNFTSKTKAFAWYTSQKEDALAANADYTITSLAVGIDHKF